MHQRSSLTNAFAGTVSCFYVLISALLIIPTYYKVPTYSLSFIKQYKALNADLPTVTKVVLGVSEISYVFIVGVLVFSALFVYKNLKKGTSLLLFVCMNLALLLCLCWSEFVSYSLTLPMIQLLRFSG